jgi:hypothetical protein
MLSLNEPEDNTLVMIRGHWDDIKLRLIKRIDADDGVFDGCTFKVELLRKYLAASGIPWPRLPSGQLALDDNT